MPTFLPGRPWRGGLDVPRPFRQTGGAHLPAWCLQLDLCWIPGPAQDRALPHATPPHHTPHTTPHLPPPPCHTAHHRVHHHRRPPPPHYRTACLLPHASAALLHCGRPATCHGAYIRAGYLPRAILFWMDILELITILPGNKPTCLHGSCGLPLPPLRGVTTTTLPQHLPFLGPISPPHCSTAFLDLPHTCHLHLLPRLSTTASVLTSPIWVEGRKGLFTAYLLHSAYLLL